MPVRTLPTKSFQCVAVALYSTCLISSYLLTNLIPPILKERNPQTKFDLAVILNDVTLSWLNLVRYDKKVCLAGKEIRWAYVLHFKHAFHAIPFQ